MARIGHLTRKPNRRIKHTAEARTYFYVRVRDTMTGELEDLLMTSYEYLRIRKRSAKNPEDLKD